MEEAQAKINQGALGFYQFLAESDSAGSSNAVSILTKASVNDQLSDNMKTKIGAEGDATSLENMKKALDFLASGSQLRAADHPDLTKWKVTNTIMAAAQVYTNAKPDAAGEYTLTYQAYNEVFSNGLVLQEQISGTGIGEDLYQGWYTEEKAVLEYYAEYIRENNGAIPTVEEVASALNISVDKVKATHYQRIIDSNYEYTGIGYNNNPALNANGDTAVQIFAQPASGEKSYTIDEYRVLFDAYYSSVTKALTDALADLAAKQSALAELQKNGGLNDKEVQAIADAEAAVEEAQNKYASASAALQTAISTQTAAEEAMISATTAVDDAKAEWNAKGEAALIAQSELVDANNTAEAKDESVIEKNTALETAKTADEAAEEALAKADQEVTDTTDQLARITTPEAEEVRQKEAALKQAESTADIEEATAKAGEEYETARKDAEAAKEAAEAKAGKDAADAKAAADQKCSRTEAEAANTRDAGISQAEKEREEAKSAAQDAKDTADAKAAADYAQKEAEAQQARASDSAVADAEAKKSQAEEEVKAAQKALDEAQADVNASETEVTNAKIAEAEAEKQAADAEEAEQIAEEVVKKYQEDLDAAQEALYVKLQDTAGTPADAGTAGDTNTENEADQSADDVVGKVRETTTDPTVTFDFESATITVGQ